MRCEDDQDWEVSKELEGEDRATFSMHTVALIGETE
jgi:hypothetical protein